MRLKMGCCGKHNGMGGAGPLSGLGEPQCLECVEKHVGEALTECEAAFAGCQQLLWESLDRYPSRLKIVGNLVQAEHHSIKWPELRSAFRDARRAFQQAGKWPDWDALSMLLSQTIKSEVKNHAGGL